MLLMLAVIQAEGSARADDDVQHTFSLTTNPVYLVYPVVEIAAEFRVGDSIGLTAIGAAGTANIAATWFVGWLAGEFRYYLVGSFIHGMQIGAHIQGTYIATNNVLGTGIGGTGAGLVAGPFLGYKIATNVGFTFDTQLGPLFLLGNHSSDVGDVAPLIRISVGWSF
jgi:hypothetical protein